MTHITNLPPAFSSVDVCLAEDDASDTILFWGWGEDGSTWIASITLPMKIAEGNFLADEWRKVERLDWRLV